MTEGDAQGRFARIRARFTRPSDLWLALRLFGWACVLPFLKRLVPLPTLVRRMHQEPRLASRDMALEERIVTLARWACRVTRLGGSANCLERGLLSYHYLTSAGADPTLFIGVSRRPQGGVDGHAWVTTDGIARGEDPRVFDIYTTIVTFDAAGLPLNHEGSPLAARVKR